jgi:hypothetical protein
MAVSFLLVKQCHSILPLPGIVKCEFPALQIFLKDEAHGYFIPDFDKSSTISLCPRRMASLTGVRPMSSFALTLEPAPSGTQRQQTLSQKPDITA